MQSKISALAAALALALVLFAGLVSFVETSAALAGVAAAVFARWASLASLSPVALATAFFVLAGPVSPVVAAPTPGTAAIAVAAVVDGLPSCAKPVMNSMVFRAASFGCDSADGTPDVACLCRSRPFKRLAKGGVHAECADEADLGASREWAIARCTAALSAGVSRVPAAGTNGTASPAPVPSAPSSSVPSGTSVAAARPPTAAGPTATVIAGSVFDIDDDEDETSDALRRQVDSGVMTLLPVMTAVAVAILLL